MKKIFLIAAAALLIGGTANAQDVFKQQGGEQNIEVQFTPLGGSPIGINGIRYRSFSSATRALRAEVFLGFQSSSEVSLGGSEGETELSMGESSFDISLAAGIENHWAGTDRLSPYWGYVGSLGFGNERATQEYVTNADDDVEKLVESSQGSLTVGVSGVVGFDYYFADNLYLGAEVGFGIQYMMMFDENIETPGSDDDGDFQIDESTAPGGNEFGIGPVVQGSIRLGFLF
jgi:outer membrane protein W